jgi:hypothetical protein
MMLRKATRGLRTQTNIHRRLRKLSIGSFDGRHPSPFSRRFMTAFRTLTAKLKNADRRLQVWSVCEGVRTTSGPG